MVAFPLPLARLITRCFTGGDQYRPAGVRILADLAAAYGLDVAERDYRGRRRVTYTDMVAELATEIGGGRPTGLVVLAYGVPDAETQWPACYLSAVLPGEPLTFTVADQGLVTPFTALRVAAAYAADPGVDRAAVVLLDQTAVLTDPSADDGSVPDVNRAVALVFDRDGGLGRLCVRLTTGVRAGDAAGLLRDRSAADGAVVVAGARLAAAAGVAGVVAGHACTGPWAALAEFLPGPVRLIEHDERIGVLGECMITPVDRSRVD